MTATSGKTASPLFDPPHLAGDALRYGTALALVTASFCGIAAALGHAPIQPEASDIDSALMIDLPPAETSSHEAVDAHDSAAAVAPQPPQPVVAARAPDISKPKSATEREQEPPPAPAPPVPLDRKVEPPQPVAAPPPSVAQAPAEAAVRADIEDSAGDEGTPHASARRISLWQKALMRRLETAKHNHHRTMNVTGTAKVAFQIDRQGIVRDAHVAASSGSPPLDNAAVALVRDASPFPAPPSGAGEKDMSFVVPIHFKR